MSSIGSSKNKIHVFIFDNNVLIRSGIHLLVECDPGIEVVGEAEISTEGLEKIKSLKPDIVLLDIDSIEDPVPSFVTSITKCAEKARIILLSESRDTQFILLAIEAGAVGVVLKTQRTEVLHKAIAKVYAGEAWIDRTMLADVLIRLTRNHVGPELDPEMERVSQLSDREQQVVQLIGQGLKNKQIAAQLYITETTVRHHLTSIFRKLEVNDRLELLIFAHRCGLSKLST